MVAGAESQPQGVEHVARALLAQGAAREAIAMLRGAVARDREEEGCAALLSSLLDGNTTIGEDEELSAIQLNFPLVDTWIRRGMLVEALALLGGTPMGGLDTGREWANLLGELLAPVPVDAEETLVETHRQLLSGGASVALTIFETRVKREPKLPAWALRRLELLRWMLLDNAKAAEPRPEPTGEVPSLLAGALRPFIHQRNIKGALEAARRFATERPDHTDAGRTVEALRALVDEIGRHADSPEAQGRTIPLAGRPAASMQLRMGNLRHAASVYQKMLKKQPGDGQTRLLLEEVQAVQRALAGEPVVEDVFGENTFIVDDAGGEQTLDHMPGDLKQLLHEEIGSLGDAFAPLEIPTTKVTDLAELGAFGSTGPDHLGARAPLELDPDVLGQTDGFPMNTAEESGARPNPSIKDAEELARSGRFDEALGIYRVLLALHPERTEWIRRAHELQLEAEREVDSGAVLVRTIRPVK